MIIAHRKLIREHRLQIRRITGHQHDISNRILEAKVLIQQLATKDHTLASYPCNQTHRFLDRVVANKVPREDIVQNVFAGFLRSSVYAYT
jgi:hypothetical protein